jgi:hypothetical protein
VYEQILLGRVQRRKLQSIAPRSVCWRCGTPRGAAPGRSSRSVSCSSISAGVSRVAVRRGQLDGEREPVEAVAERRHGDDVLGGDREVVRRRAGARLEQRQAGEPASAIATPAAVGRTSSALGVGRGGTGYACSPYNPRRTRLETSTLSPGAAASSSASTSAGGVGLLEVVEHGEDRLVAELLDERVQRPPAGHLPHLDRPGQRGQHLVLGLRGLQRDEDHPSSNLSATAAATASDSRVLPMPPGRPA